MIAVRGERTRQAFLSGYITGLIFFGATLYWVSYVAIIGALALTFYLALYLGVFAVGVDILLFQFPKPRVRYAVLVSFLWVGLEYLRSRFFSGFGWALMGHTQWESPLIIQIADIAGAYGVSFLIVFINALISSKIKKKMKGFRPEQRYLAFLIMILIATAMYGYYKLDRRFIPVEKIHSVKEESSLTGQAGDEIKISVIQGNIPQYQKWDENYADGILKKYISLTRESAKDKPNLIIWPETAVPGFLESDKELFDKISKLTKEVNTYLLVGAPTEILADKGPYFNSAALFSPEGKLIKRYDKMHLVPFGEYVPLGESFFSFVRTRYDVGEDYSPGKEYTIFEVPISKKKTAKFGVLICFEDVFPDLVREFVKRGADFMVVITNDAWFMKTGAPYQHAQSSVFRAVENRVNVIRCANTGYSCFIDQKGRISDSVKNAEGEKIFVDGFVTSKIVPVKAETFYFRHGDVFARACVWVFLFDLGFYFIYTLINLRRRRSGRDKRSDKAKDK